MALLIAALLALTPVTADQAKQAFPAVNLSDLTDQQRGTFIDAAAELLNYAGCQDTLAICLNPAAKDPHALREAALVHQLVKEGVPAGLTVQLVEKYYDSFAPKNRAQLKADNCPVEGKGPIELIEFSDYQCPHCAVALPQLTALVQKERKGSARLCSKYFPFTNHPRARIAALCAEYARSKGKFWEMNAALFAHQESLEDGDLKAIARDVGLDADEMLKEAYSGKYDGQVEKHRREGIAAGVDGTPALFIDGRLDALPLQPWYLQFTVDDELQWRKEKGWKFSPSPAARKIAKGK